MLDNSKVDLGAFQGVKDDIQPYMFDEYLTRTKFVMVNWSTFEILHNADVSFMCFDNEGNKWAILQATKNND